MAREALGLAARVDEHQRRAVLAHQLREPVVDLRPHLARHHRFERGGGDLQLQVALAHVPGVDDGAVGTPVGQQVTRADEEARHVLDRLLRRRQPHACELASGERLEPLEGQRQVHTAFAAGHGVDLIHDHRARAREHLPAGLRSHEDVERLGRGHHDVRRPATHGRALVLRRVAGAHEGADVKRRQRERRQLLADTGQGRLEVLVDVVRERLQRRDVHDGGLVGECAVRYALAHQAIEHGKKRGERLTRAGGRGDEHVTLRGDRRPRRLLGRGGRGKRAAEPVGHGRVKVRQHAVIEAHPSAQEELGRAARAPVQ